MLFNSAEYLFLFLPIVLIVFVRLSKSGSTETQINWLIAASVIFYGSWNPVYLILILCSVVVNYLVGRQLARSDEAQRHWWLITGVGFNLGLLAYFKYAGFFVDNLNTIGLWLIPLPDIVLPLAISFFTFQQIAYLVDVSRRECAEYQFRHYALFVLFFPQLIAGPIVHHKEMMPQFEQLRPRLNLPTDLAVGLSIIAIGLFKKAVLADSLGVYADTLFEASAAGKPLTSLDSWIATLCFSFQIYFDFSGYSDIAIGSARLFGIRLPENFRSPYKSSSIIEFWRRWHMTLSRFLRDYLYISLGGNRRGSSRRYANLLTTMLLGGLWHGAAWTYVIWGGLHGLFLCINHAWHKLCDASGLGWLQTVRTLQPVYTLLTFVCCSVAFAVFRSTDSSSALTLISAAFGVTSDQSIPLLQASIIDSSLGQIFHALGAASGTYLPVYCLLVLSASICWLLPNTQQFMAGYQPVLETSSPVPQDRTGLQWQAKGWSTLAIAVLLSAGLYSLSAVSEFIYFQF